MALRAITNDRHGLPAEKAKIGIGVVEELGHPAGSKNCAMKELTQGPVPHLWLCSAHWGEFGDRKHSVVVIMVAKMFAVFEHKASIALKFEVR